MYRLSDTPSAIREVQKYLYVIYDRVNHDVPRVSIDGIYGTETRWAIKEFQRIYGVKETGEVNLETFNMLYELYREARINDELSSFILTDGGFPITVGVQNNDVILIHAMLDEIARTYVDMGRVNPKSNYFSAESAAAVRYLQKIFRMEESGIVDSHFYERLKLEMQSIQRLNEEYL